MDCEIITEENKFFVKEVGGEYRPNLTERIFNFVVGVIKYLKRLEKRSIVNNVIVYQLSKAASSMGANYEEAQGASSRGDFGAKVAIAHREAKETNYWLRIIKRSELDNCQELDHLIQESGELRNILGTIVGKIRNRNLDCR